MAETGESWSDMDKSQTFLHGGISKGKQEWHTYSEESLFWFCKQNDGCNESRICSGDYWYHGAIDRCIHQTTVNFDGKHKHNHQSVNVYDEIPITEAIGTEQQTLWQYQPGTIIPRNPRQNAWNWRKTLQINLQIGSQWRTCLLIWVDGAWGFH